MLANNLPKKSFEEGDLYDITRQNVSNNANIENKTNANIESKTNNKSLLT